MRQTISEKLSGWRQTTTRLPINKGVQHMLLSTLWFSLMQVCIKKLRHLPAMEIVFFRCCIAILLCAVPLWRGRIPWLGNSRLRLFLRGVFGTIALGSSFIVIQNMPLASAVTIQYLSPIFTVIVAVFLLSERVRAAQWLFFGVSFAGIVVLKGFDPRIELRFLLVGVMCAFFTGLAYTLVRSLKEREHPVVVVLHFQIVGVFAGLLSLFFFFVAPRGIDWLYLLLVGIFTQLGQINLTKSLQAERVAFVSSLNYLGIVYAVLFGLVFFGETYDWRAALGILMVIAGVILNLRFGRKAAPAKESAPAAEVA